MAISSAAKLPPAALHNGMDSKAGAVAIASGMSDALRVGDNMGLPICPMFDLHKHSALGEHWKCLYSSARAFASQPAFQQRQDIQRFVGVAAVGADASAQDVAAILCGICDAAPNADAVWDSINACPVGLRTRLNAGSVLNELGSRNKDQLARWAVQDALREHGLYQSPPSNGLQFLSDMSDAMPVPDRKNQHGSSSTHLSPPAAHDDAEFDGLIDLDDGDDDSDDSVGDIGFSLSPTAHPPPPPMSVQDNQPPIPAHHPMHPEADAPEALPHMSNAMPVSHHKPEAPVHDDKGPHSSSNIRHSPQPANDDLADLFDLDDDEFDSEFDPDHGTIAERNRAALNRQACWELLNEPPEPGR